MEYACVSDEISWSEDEFGFSLLNNEIIFIYLYTSIIIILYTIY